MVAFAERDRDPLCCFIVFGGIAFSCWFAEKGREFATLLLTQLKGLNMSAMEFLCRLADINKEVVLAPLMRLCL